jgi:hypothetical protein
MYSYVVYDSSPTRPDATTPRQYMNDSFFRSLTKFGYATAHESVGISLSLNHSEIDE